MCRHDLRLIRHEVVLVYVADPLGCSVDFVRGSDGASGSRIIWPNIVALRFHRMSAVLAESPASVNSCACSGVVAMTCSVFVFFFISFFFLWNNVNNLIRVNS